LTLSQCQRLIITLLNSLPDINVEQESLDIVLSVLKRDQLWIVQNPDYIVSPSDRRKIINIVTKRRHGIPLAYVLGIIRYGDLVLKVNQHCLIPRPETEQLIETARNYLLSQPNRAWRIIDIGTGTGLIAISLAQCCKEHSLNCHIDATDISLPALKVAKANVKKYQLSKTVSVYKQDLFTNNSQTYNLIVANLPYVPSSNIKGLKDPILALDGGSDGLDLVRTLLSQLHTSKIHTNIILEIGTNQAGILEAYVCQLWPQATIKADNDLAGFNRVVQITI